MLTRTQVCQRLGIGKNEFARLARTGELAAIRIGTTPTSPYRVSEEALADFIERHKVVPDKADVS